MDHGFKMGRGKMDWRNDGWKDEEKNVEGKGKQRYVRINNEEVNIYIIKLGENKGGDY